MCAQGDTIHTAGQFVCLLRIQCSSGLTSPRQQEEVLVVSKHTCFLDTRDQDNADVDLQTEASLSDVYFHALRIVALTI